MRLLDANTLELVDVRDDEIPPYVILSHTWGDEEISLQELWHMKGRLPQSLDNRKRAIAAKKGFCKVRDAAALAVFRGFSYLWVDTCCIDKSSSAELSEAINSMYLWYQRSEECYAFLSDVESAKDEDWSWPNSSFRRSRWFTRGWTLQELIAPKTVHFFAKDWSILGHRNGPSMFMEIISDVTGIDGEVLDGRIDPLQLSVSTRMKWASKRHTTRLEDTAYCLMGLFQVNMPLLYGEGHRAFTRLQEEIIQRSDDQSLYAWNSFDNAEEDTDTLYGLLAHSPAQFKETGEIQPLPPSPVYASAPSGMTNHGLRVQLYLRPILESDGVPMEEDYYAILDCFVRVGDQYQCPAILLRRLSQDQYARFQTMSKFLLPPLQSEFPEYEGYRTIYVRQDPVYYNLPQFTVSPLHIRSEVRSQDHQHHYELSEAYPPRQWNSATMTMKVKYSRKLQAMGVFRFLSRALNKKVDIVVGLRRLNAMQWEGWCFQRSYHGDSLESTLTMINHQVTDLTRKKHSITSSGMLRDSLGDDSNLMTDATVEGMQLQGRLYISISMSIKPEIFTTREIEPSSIQNTMQASHLRNLQLQAMTGPCSQDYRGGSMFTENIVSMIEPLPVRGKPSSPKLGLDTTIDLFMKPLHDFLVRVRDEKAKAEPESTINFAEQLALALFDGDVVEIERLLSLGESLETYTSDLYGFAPLHWAVAGGSVESIRLLFQNGVDALFTTKMGWTAIHVSALSNKSVWKAIMAQYWFSSEDDLEDLASKLANSRTDDHFETALHLAATSSLNSDYEDSFFWELSGDLLKHSYLFSRNKHDETPLHRAAAFNNVGVIRSIARLRDEGKLNFINVVDNYGRTPLWHAAATGSCEAIEALITLDASVDLADDIGRTPLHAACRGGHQKAVELLLHEGARQLPQSSVMGLTVLDYAAMFGYAKCLPHLLNLSSLMNEQQSRSLETLAALNRALHIAASCGSRKCVEFLCKAGANPYQSFDLYLKLDDSKSYAIIVDKSCDAAAAAAMEGNREILKYFTTSDTCKKHRLRKQSGSDIPLGFSDDVDAITSQRPSVPEGAAQSELDIVDYGEAYPAQQQPQSAVAPIPLPSENPPVSSGYSTVAQNRYGSPRQTYRDSINPRASAPFANPSSGIGSHSAILPALSSPAHPQLGSGQGPSAYNQNQKSTVASQTTVVANLVRMLGPIGNQSMLQDPPPTEPELLRYDFFKDDFVHQIRETEGSSTLDGNGFPVFEIATESDVLLNDGSGSAQASPQNLEAGETPAVDSKSARVDTLNPLVSSTVSPGFWDRLG
ncbi:hypothetical protein BP6252_11048 [Coleophoma cylindrospora]|uniref:Uncharacterized protein n=1 Tax=Coleophoma cylindrospora TaxID=1849047 RepID=A0A3D8QNV2_9HELO|nr:hypothetical protein BP6252_11048 [Coleophoma cylindrospora]